VQVLRRGRSRDSQSGASGDMSLFPTVGKPGVEITCRPRRKVHQQLHEIKLRTRWANFFRTSVAYDEDDQPEGWALQRLEGGHLRRWPLQKQTRDGGVEPPLRERQRNPRTPQAEACATRLAEVGATTRGKNQEGTIYCAPIHAKRRTAPPCEAGRRKG
jgi:hypothetical protein